MRSLFKTPRRIHFVGIGGVGTLQRRPAQEQKRQQTRGVRNIDELVQVDVTAAKSLRVSQQQRAAVELADEARRRLRRRHIEHAEKLALERQHLGLGVAVSLHHDEVLTAVHGPVAAAPAILLGDT